MLLKIQTKSNPTLVLVQKDNHCSVYQTDTIEVVLVGQIFNDLRGYQNAGHYFYEKVVSDPAQNVAEIDGYFGVIVLDKATASVTVYRDPIGMQPLYYSVQNEAYLFSTTLKAIQKESANTQPCEEFFLKCLEEIVPNTYELTMYDGIFRIAPNSLYLFEDGAIINKQQLFDFEAITIQHYTDEEAIRVFQEKLEKAVGNFVEGHKDLFFQYTGGLDSTGILAVSRFLRGNTDRFHTYIHQYLPDHESFDEMHLVKKLHHTEGLPLPFYTPETKFETMEEEVAHGKAHHVFGVINQVLENTYFDMKSKNGKLLFSGFGGDEGITFNESPRFFMNQIKDFRLDKMLNSVRIYGLKRFAARLIKIDLREYLLKIFSPNTILPTSFDYRKNPKSKKKSKENLRYARLHTLHDHTTTCGIPH